MRRSGPHMRPAVVLALLSVLLLVVGGAQAYWSERDSYDDLQLQPSGSSLVEAGVEAHADVTLLEMAAQLRQQIEACPCANDEDAESTDSELPDARVNGPGADLPNEFDGGAQFVETQATQTAPVISSVKAPSSVKLSVASVSAAKVAAAVKQAVAKPAASVSKPAASASASASSQCPCAAENNAKVNALKAIVEQLSLQKSKASSASSSQDDEKINALKNLAAKIIKGKQQPAPGDDDDSKSSSEVLKTLASKIAAVKSGGVSKNSPKDSTKTKDDKGDIEIDDKKGPTPVKKSSDDGLAEETTHAKSADGVLFKITANKADKFNSGNMAWNNSGGFYYTAPDALVAQFKPEQKGASITFRASERVPFKKVQVFLTGPEGTDFGAIWWVQVSFDCKKFKNLDYTGRLTQGWNEFSWDPPGLAVCWRWSMIKGGSDAMYTNFRWYPMMPNDPKVCEEEAWKDADLEFPWSANIPVHFRKDCDDSVRLRGSVNITGANARMAQDGNPDTTPALILPDTYRPSQWTALTCPTGDGKKVEFYDFNVDKGFVGVVFIQTDGKVAPQTFDSNLFSLDHVSFVTPDYSNNWNALPVSKTYAPFFNTNVNWRKDLYGNIRLRGSVKFNGDMRLIKDQKPEIATLPPAARPKQTIAITAATGWAGDRATMYDAKVTTAIPGFVFIYPSGRVVPQAFNQEFVSLDGVMFAGKEKEVEDTWQDVPLNGDWKEFDESITIMFRRDSAGRVYLRGWVALDKAVAAKLDAKQVPFIVQLPEGYRPPQLAAFPAATGSGPGTDPAPYYDGIVSKGTVGTIVVTPDGKVYPVNFDWRWLSLDDVSFSIFQ